MKLATIKQIKEYINSDPLTWKKKDKDLKHKDREDNVMFKAYYWVIIKYLKIREERKEMDLFGNVSGSQLISLFRNHGLCGVKRKKGERRDKIDR